MKTITGKCFEKNVNTLKNEKKIRYIIDLL